MLCKNCKNNPLVRGFKYIVCLKCGKSTSTYFNYKDICSYCSTNLKICQCCGNNINTHENECETHMSETNTNGYTYVNMQNLKPYTCPVCGGTGFVQQGFYSQTSGTWSTTSISTEKCRSCGGTGVLWH
jgi:hypothetical protein